MQLKLNKFEFFGQDFIGIGISTNVNLLKFKNIFFYYFLRILCLDKEFNVHVEINSKDKVEPLGIYTMELKAKSGGLMNNERVKNENVNFIFLK